MVNAFPLRLEDVVITRRGSRLLGPVTFSLPPDGLTIVLGPNGAGKTTLLRTLHGLERLHSGAIHAPSDMSAIRDDQGFVFQSPIVLRRTVRANLAYPLELKKHSRREIDDAVSQWAQRTNLATALERRAPDLSGGEKQKLALARALIHKPKMLLLDEPCANLDGRSTREIEDLLQETVAKGTRVVMTTHNLGQAKRLATDVILLIKGEIHEQASADQFFSAPCGALTQRFLDGEILE